MTPRGTCLSRALRVTATTLALTACASAPPPAVTTAPSAQSDASAPGVAPFDDVGESWIRVNATIGERTATRLMFDTGGGVTLLSRTLCAKVGCVEDGTFTGQRMSGQSLTLPMARVPSITIAGHRVTNARVAVLDTSSLLHPELGVEGFAALDLFRDSAITIDYPGKRLVVESPSTLQERARAGVTTRVRVEHDGPSTVVYLPLTLDETSTASPLEMEVDTGSNNLILDDRFMAPLGIDPAATGVKRVEGTDETGHAYVRTYTTLPRAVRVPSPHGAPSVTAPAGSGVMFQRIIHDGLVGQRFLRPSAVTFDLVGGAMIFAPRG